MWLKAIPLQSITFGLERWGVVLVNTHTALGHITSILLSMRGSPSAESREIGEGWIVVIVSIP